jgi:hypothetical protein
MHLYLRLFSKGLLLLSDFEEYFFEQLIGAEGRGGSPHTLRKASSVAEINLLKKQQSICNSLI